MNEIKTETIISEINSILKSRYKDFMGIYFYGSRARGDQSMDSDYDLILVFNRKIEWRFKEEVRHIIYGLEDKYDIFIDCKLVSHHDITMETMPLIRNVKAHGVFYGV